MNVRPKLLAVFAFWALLVAGCASHVAAPAAAPAALATPAANETPLQQLIDGNARYAAGHPLHPNQDVQRREELAAGQHPIAVIVSCSDSRVPPEIVFDQGLGDLFVVRTAGNVVDDVALGSVEYAVDHLHARLIVVLGHEQCGAVKAAIAGGEAPGHIGSIVQQIQPAVTEARQWPGNLLDNAINANVRYTVRKIKSDQVLSHEVQTGELIVLGARYQLAPGTVQWLTK